MMKKNSSLCKSFNILQEVCILFISLTIDYTIWFDFMNKHKDTIKKQKQTNKQNKTKTTKSEIRNKTESNNALANIPHPCTKQIKDRKAKAKTKTKTNKQKNTHTLKYYTFLCITFCCAFCIVILMYLQMKNICRQFNINWKFSSQQSASV